MNAKKQALEVVGRAKRMEFLKNRKEDVKRLLDQEVRKLNNTKANLLDTAESKEMEKTILQVEKVAEKQIEKIENNIKVLQSYFNQPFAQGFVAFKQKQRLRTGPSAGKDGRILWRKGWMAAKDYFNTVKV